MTAEQLAVYAGVVLSLALAYIPALKNRFDPLPAETKAQIMGGLLVVVALAVFGLSCSGLYPLVACSVDGAKELVNILIAALIANQATFLLAVRPFQKSAV